MHFCSRTESDVKSTEAALSSSASQSSGTVSGAVVDVSKPDQVEEWIKGIAASEKRLDVIVSNVSGLAIPNTPEAWTVAYQTDMMGTVSLINACLPHLEQSKGNIITISSVSGRDIDFTAPGPYGTFKAAIIHYTAQCLYSLESFPFPCPFQFVLGCRMMKSIIPPALRREEPMLTRDLKQWHIPLLRKESEQTPSVQGIFTSPTESGEV